MPLSIRLRGEQTLRVALRIGGLLTTAIGLMHIFVPTTGYSTSIASAMQSEIRDHFYYLATYAICTFLLTLGFISIYISKIKFAHTAFVICTALGILWIGRAILEIQYPVRVSLFFLEKPTMVLLPVIIFIAATYSTGAILYMARQKNRPA